MDGFLRRRIPLVRRDCDPPRRSSWPSVSTRPALWCCRRLCCLSASRSRSSAGDVHPRADIMGALVNRRLTTLAASGVAAVIIALNLVLLWQTVS